MWINGVENLEYMAPTALPLLFTLLAKAKEADNIAGKSLALVNFMVNGLYRLKVEKDVKRGESCRGGG